MVYVLDINGQPLIPTSRHGKIRRLLKEGKAKVVKTIRLLYDCTHCVQEITLGVDAGSKLIGLSATTKDKELYASEVELRNDIVTLLSTRRELRRSRRNRKTRYRKPRFNNRRRGDKWLAPSVEAKVESHMAVVQKVCKMLPISKIIVETASFDIQKIKNPDIISSEYQQCNQLGFWNVREYILFRDGHQCQCCKGKTKDPVLNVHHMESRKTGGDAPNNLITLCETCHKGYHSGTVILPKNIKRGMSFRDAAFMGIVRWAFYNKLKEIFESSGVPVHMTFGYLTKNTRIQNNLPKEHIVDARCISGNPLATPSGEIFYQKKVRCHNRQLHKCTVQKGGLRKANQAAKYVKGFQLFDKVSYHGKKCFIFGRRSSGSFDIRTLNGTKVSAGVSYKKLQLLEKRKTYLIERRTAY